MHVIVDIGNSSVKAAVFSPEGELVDRRRLRGDFAESFLSFVLPYEITACAVASVGPRHEKLLAAVKSLDPHTLIINGTTPTPLVMDYRTPETLGADRLAAAVGALTLARGQETLVVDAGSCITYDFISADGRYRGGNISLGLGMRLRALHEQTARLPLILADGECPPIGQDTETAIRSGVIRGMNLEINGYIRQLRRTYPDSRVFLTGGNASRFAQEMDVDRHDTLVELGIHTILTYNR